ncbi:iron-sulfur cluster biosynthesis protein [Amycolatopsis sp. cg5]|uniref:iron-sulfur cluster biosynthesis protein n=1 Tax=Amycolatopsis sp. cg5 TaxID=3238802 RepID=UPI0035253CDE
MLAMTEAAAEAISALTAQLDEETAGVRFAMQQQGDEPALALSVAPEPQSGDQILGTEAGAKVFLEQAAAEILDDKVLDVQRDDEGQLNFAVLQQPDQPLA